MIYRIFLGYNSDKGRRQLIFHLLQIYRAHFRSKPISNKNKTNQKVESVLNSFLYKYQMVVSIFSNN